MKPNGGPAFPIAAYTLDTTGHPMLMVKDGMTLRDYFAAAALRGCCEWDAIINQKHAVFMGADGFKRLAECSYMIADAMLAERDK